MKIWEVSGIGGIRVLHKLVVCIAEDALKGRSTSHSYRVLPRRIEKMGGCSFFYLANYVVYS